MPSMQPQNTLMDQQFKERLNKLLKEKSEKLMTIFIQDGPAALREKIGAKKDEHWQYIFDYLVFNEQVLKSCLVNFMPFFKHLVVRGGPAVLRKVFQIEEKKYDVVYEKLFDLVAVQEGAVFDHLFLKKDEYVLKILNNQTIGIRQNLCPLRPKYDQLWWKLLEMLQQAVCTDVYPEHKLNHGLRAFDTLMNGLREHRSLRSFKAMWEFEEAGV